MTATINQIISNVLAALIIIIMAIAFTSVYWCLKFDHELKIQKRLKKQLEALHLDRMKDRVALEKQAKTLKSKLDFYYHVLYEVHQEKWNMVYSQLDERPLLLREMVDSTLKLMSYEDVKDVVFDRITGKNINIKIICVRLRLCKAITKLLDGSIYLDPSHENGTSVVLLIKI